MIDDDIQNDTDRRIAPVRRLDQVDEVLLGPEMRVDVQVIVDVVAVICAGIIFENWRNPDGGTTKSCDVVQMIGDAFDFATVEIVRRGNSPGSPGLEDRRTSSGIVETIDHQEIYELFAPLAREVEIVFAWNRRQIHLLDGCRTGHLGGLSGTPNQRLTAT